MFQYVSLHAHGDVHIQPSLAAAGLVKCSNGFRLVLMRSCLPIACKEVVSAAHASSDVSLGITRISNLDGQILRLRRLHPIWAWEWGSGHPSR